MPGQEGVGNRRVDAVLPPDGFLRRLGRDFPEGLAVDAGRGEGLCRAAQGRFALRRRALERMQVASKTLQEVDSGSHAA